MAVDQFRAALTGANSVGAPTDNPLGASMAPLLQNFYNAQFQQGAGSRAVGAFATDQAIKADNASRAAEADRQAKLEESKQKIQQLQDAIEGKNYQQVKKQDGGYDYYDPLGNRVSVAAYAKATGKSPDQILKDSENSLDQQYVNDHANLTKLLGFIRNGDQQGAKDFLAKNPGVSSKYINDNWKTPGFADQLVKQFVEAYPNVYSGDPYGSQRGINREGQYGLYGQPKQQQSGNGFVNFLSSLSARPSLLNINLR